MPICTLSGRNPFPLPLHAPADQAVGESWSGFENDLTRLDATITDLAIGGSQPSIQVRARDGVNWTIELAGRDRTHAAGLTDRQAAPGDTVQIVGHQSRSTSDSRIKARHLTIAGRAFELYPDACVES